MTQRDSGSIWSHLPSAFGTERPQTNKQSSLADAMWPGLAKPPPQPNPDRESLLRHLRELNTRIDARKGRR